MGFYNFKNNSEYIEKSNPTGLVERILNHGKIGCRENFLKLTILPSETMKPKANHNTLENLLTRKTPRIFTN